jgi:hypothetical protein
MTEFRNMTIHQKACFLLAWDDGDEALDQFMAEHGHEISDAVIAELKAEQQRRQEFFDERESLFAGLPLETTLGEAIRIKARQGDPVALKWVRNEGWRQEIQRNAAWYRDR